MIFRDDRMTAPRMNLGMEESAIMLDELKDKHTEQKKLLEELRGFL